MKCYCGSKKPFSKCCEPFLEDKALPKTPEELMRSRYSAYVVGNGAYIVKTTTKENRYEDDVALIEEYAKSVEWLGLEVVASKEQTVEFRAYYKDGNGIKVQHEKSNFICEEGNWLYKDGKIFNSKIERNDPCPCQSGKKYKKCCA
ncbi:MAG: YchJ family protein [Sulfurimonas sp.]|uniref:YchJ family protein n=1 Tax=Sulfurimonas sp. TaxID=2022749 RepID=UPI0026225C5A|nr:YchJ family protein [Sulfurimonas sp.]MDD2653364.1 YchJ family protein [Sulfurimonas sp.]MDD3450670.1 YchJ family protein [Sulfurimonas sp.]